MSCDLEHISNSQPDFKSRAQEARQLDFLYAMGKRYPHAWYARRFFKPVAVSEDPGPHFGMGLECYVQWTSPIRRLTDLQVSDVPLCCTIHFQCMLSYFCLSLLALPISAKIFFPTDDDCNFKIQPLPIRYILH